MSFKMRIVWRALVWYTWRLGRYYLLLHITTDRTQGRTDNEISDWTMRNWDVDTQWSQVRLTSSFSSSCCQSEIPTKSCLAVSRNNQRQITTVDRRTIVGRDVYIVRLTLEINETFEGLLTVVLWSQFTAIIVANLMHYLYRIICIICIRTLRHLDKVRQSLDLHKSLWLQSPEVWLCVAVTVCA